MANKVEKVAELTGLFQNSNAVFLTEYRGLTVGQLKQLRRSISENATYAVAKNTLIEIAAKNAGVTAFDGQLFGPTALAFASGDAVAVAKSMRDFAKENPLLVVKSGILDGVALSAEEVKKLADLETREVLLAKAAGMFKASRYKAASTIQAPLSQAVRTVDALRAKQAA
ncbi:MAG: 50S ribosomal protein L10 [Rhodoluna sp.]